MKKRIKNEYNLESDNIYISFYRLMKNDEHKLMISYDNDECGSRLYLTLEDAEKISDYFVKINPVIKQLKEEIKND